MSPSYTIREFKDIPKERFPFIEKAELLRQLLPFFEQIDPAAVFALPPEVTRTSQTSYDDYWAGVVVHTDIAELGVYRPPGRKTRQPDGSYKKDPSKDGLGYKFDDEDGGYWRYLSIHIWYVKGAKMIELRGRRGDVNAMTYTLTARGPKALHDACEALLAASPLDLDGAT